MSAKEGLYAYMYLGTACPTGTANPIALFTGVELSWSQTKRRFYQAGGSLHPSQVLRGIISWEGRFKKAYIDNTYLGTFNQGTIPFCGSIVPRGGSSPAIMGTVELTGGALSNMEAENEAAVMEDQGFIIYNLTFVG